MTPRSRPGISPLAAVFFSLAGLVYGVWLVGIAVPVIGALAQRTGPQRLLPVLVSGSLAIMEYPEVALTEPERRFLDQLVEAALP